MTLSQETRSAESGTSMEGQCRLRRNPSGELDHFVSVSTKSTVTMEN